LITQVCQFSVWAAVSSVTLYLFGGGVAVGQLPGDVGCSFSAVFAFVVMEGEDGRAFLPGVFLVGGAREAFACMAVAGNAPAPGAEGVVGADFDVGPAFVGVLAAAGEAGDGGQGGAGDGGGLGDW
jgi:hypothetical protein